MLKRTCTSLLAVALLSHGCSAPDSVHAQPLKYKATGASPQVLALYEAWFGHPQHINVGYSSHDPAKIKAQMLKAKEMGISGFVVDWYGDRQPFIDQSYALMQAEAGKENFQIAMMYDETDQDDGATDEALADLTMFHDTYLTSKAAGNKAYLTYQGRPVIFIFPKGRHTDWSRIRTLVNRWSVPPLLIYENLPEPNRPDQNPDAFDGYYAWVQPGAKGWAPDGSNWGDTYLSDFYQTMHSKYADKIIVGAEWASFDDSKASWSLNRHISARCGQTFADTTALWRKNFPPDDMLPFVMIDTWNDHEEGTAVEDGMPSCNAAGQPTAGK